MKPLFSFLLFLGIQYFAFGQQIITEKFTFENTEVNYKIMTSKSYTNKVYIFIDEKNEVIQSCIQRLNSCSDDQKDKALFYFVTFPKESKKSKEAFFLEFVSNILNNRKLIDNKLYVFSKGNYTSLYFKTKKDNNNNRYKHGYLNDIEKIFLDFDIDKLCSYLK